METTALALFALAAFAGCTLYIRSHIYSANVDFKGVGPGRTRPKAAALSNKTAVAARSPYRSTSIECASSACAAAQAISGKRFLDIDRVTPVLPLESCDASRCNCRYQRHEDRRESDEDRRHPGVGLQSEVYARGERPERREKRRGRRKSDWA